MSNFIGKPLAYDVADLMQLYNNPIDDASKDDIIYLQGIAEKIRDEGSIEKCFIDYGLDIHYDDHRRLHNLSEAYKSLHYEIRMLFLDNGIDL
jgi:hypothetical protein